MPSQNFWWLDLKNLPSLIVGFWVWSVESFVELTLGGKIEGSWS